MTLQRVSTIDLHRLPNAESHLNPPAFERKISGSTRASARLGHGRSFVQTTKSMSSLPEQPASARTHDPRSRRCSECGRRVPLQKYRVDSGKGNQTDAAERCTRGVYCGCLQPAPVAVHSRLCLLLLFVL